MTPHATKARRPSRGANTRTSKGNGSPRPQFRVVQTRRTFEEVAAQVRKLLFSGSLQPGDRLPAERELSQMLGIGRPALREALRALEVSGLITLRKGKVGGAFVTGGDPRVVSGGMADLVRLGKVSIEQLFEAREWFLSSLVRPVCQRVTLKELELLRENVAVAEHLHEAGLYQERIEQNSEFYVLLAEASRNPFALLVVRSLSDALRGLIEAVGSDLAPSFFARRRELIKALAARDEESALKLMVQSVKATEQTYKRLQQERTTRAKSSKGR